MCGFIVYYTNNGKTTTNNFGDQFLLKLNAGEIYSLCAHNGRDLSLYTLLVYYRHNLRGNEVLIMGSLGEKTTYQSSGTIRVKINTRRCVCEKTSSAAESDVVNYWLEGNVLHYITEAIISEFGTTQWVFL